MKIENYTPIKSIYVECNWRGVPEIYIGGDGKVTMTKTFTVFVSDLFEELASSFGSVFDGGPWNFKMPGSKDTYDLKDGVQVTLPRSIMLNPWANVRDLKRYVADIASENGESVSLAFAECVPRSVRAELWTAYHKALGKRRKVAETNHEAPLKDRNNTFGVNDIM